MRVLCLLVLVSTTHAIPLKPEPADFMTAFWELWHKHYVDLQLAKSAMPVNLAEVGATSSRSSGLGAGVPSATLTDKEVREKLKLYWQYLSNSTLAHLPEPQAKNVALHSDGIFDGVMTASIEWDHAEDEEHTVSKYWFRFSSDCTDMGRVNPTLPPVLVMQIDPLEQRYRVTLGPISVPEGATCLLLYTADLEGQPYSNPVPLPLPQFRFPKPELHISAHCQTGWNGCFTNDHNSTSCSELLGLNCCVLPACIGCRECSQVRNLEPPVPRYSHLAAVGPACTDRWERQGFSSRFGFSCATAVAWGLMNCVDDAHIGLCFKTCAFCDPDLYPVESGELLDSEQNQGSSDGSPAFPDSQPTIDS